MDFLLLAEVVDWFIVVLVYFWKEVPVFLMLLTV